MSVGFNPKNEQPLEQELKVQELAIRGDDYQLYYASPGTNNIAITPYLGSAGSYAALGASTITNTGSSVLTGDLGLYPGTSVTGFPPGTVSGTENIANSAAMQAQIDALAGYTTLAAHSSTIIPSALDGQTLSAGYYSFTSGAATLANSAPGTLTLNGSSSDIFVIKTASTLTTGAGGAATIALTGGAVASNVYFLVGSSATLNVTGGSTHRGNVIASSSITVGGSAVNGSLIALNGAVTFSSATTVAEQNGPVSSPTTNITILIREPVDQVYLAELKVDSSNSFIEFPQASISVISDNLDPIFNIAAGNPSVITTTFPHGFITGDQVLIANSNSTPAVNSIYPVIVLSPTTFSIPVNVTVAGTSGTVVKYRTTNDKGAIKISGLPGTLFAPNDVIIVKYTVLEHL